MHKCMKEQLAQLLIQIGLFFANCDVNYDPREKTFIQNFLRSLELNRILVPGTYNKDVLENVVYDDIDKVMADVKKWRSLILPCLEHGSASQNMVLRRYIFSISFVPLHHEA